MASAEGALTVPFGKIPEKSIIGKSLMEELQQLEPKEFASVMAQHLNKTDWLDPVQVVSTPKTFPKVVPQTHFPELLLLPGDEGFDPPEDLVEEPKLLLHERMVEVYHPGKLATLQEWLLCEGDLVFPYWPEEGYWETWDCEWKAFKWEELYDALPPSLGWPAPTVQEPLTPSEEVFNAFGVSESVLKADFS